MSCEDTNGKRFVELFGREDVSKAIKRLGIDLQRGDERKVSTAMDIRTATKEIYYQNPTIN